MPSTIIRPAQLIDTPLVATISRAAYHIYPDRLGRQPKPMIQDYSGPVANGEVSILEVDGTPVGVLILATKPDHLLIYSVALMPASQGKGHGKRLMRTAEKAALAGGFSEIRLYTNAKMVENLAFYKSLGFVETERKPHARFPDSILVFVSKRI
jgi:ribosomal protein S18 acetylase RimI-like enzyme